MTRIESLKKYLVDVLNELNKEFRTVNVNFLGNEVGNYSIDKIPIETIADIDILGTVTKRNAFNFRSRNAYGSDVAENLSNVGFWEAFEDKIYLNNEQGILPEIKGIQSIKCLNCGSLQRADTQTCEMSIQIQIEYREMEEQRWQED